MDMELVRLESPEGEAFRRAMELYRGSFPPHEQRREAAQRVIMGRADYHFDLIYDGAAFVGLLLSWETAAFCYVEHFCIAPEVRGQRYGQRALELLHRRGKPVILEIDPPVDEMSRRRQGFYERAGYRVNPFPHVHPPYRAGVQGHALVVLSWPRALSQAEYDGFDRCLKETVMADL